MTKIAAEMSDSRPAEAAGLCREAQALAERFNYDQGRAYALGILIFCEIVLAHYREALAHGLESLEMLRSLGEEDRACRRQNQIACIYRYLGDYPRAAESYVRWSRLPEN